jgi:MoxR-like ATPase
MISRATVKIVDFGARQKLAIIVVGALLLLGSATFDALTFSINTDVEALISQNLPWQERQVELNEAFPQRAISVVVTAPTAENAEIATDELAQRLSKPAFLKRPAAAGYDRNGERRRAGSVGCNNSRHVR